MGAKADIPASSNRVVHLLTSLTRLVTGVLLLNLFVIALVGWSLYQSRLQHTDRAAVVTQNLVHLLDQNIASLLDRSDLALRAVQDEFGRQAGEHGVNRLELDRFLVRQLSYHPFLTSLRMTDSRGTVCYGTGLTNAPRPNNADRDYFFRQRDNPRAGLVIAKPVFARISKKWVIPISRRLDSPDGSFAGVVYANVSLDDITRLFASIDVGRNGIVTLRDGEMGLIVRQPALQGDAGAIGHRSVSNELRSRLAAGQTNGTYFTPAGGPDSVPRMVSYHKINSHDLYIIVGLAVSDYLTAWRKEFFFMLSAVTLFSTLSFLFLWMIKRDLAARKQAEELMYQKEKLLAVHGLAFGMAHEINNPLHVIAQAAQNIERRLSPELPGNLKAAEEAGIHLGHMRAYCEQREIPKFTAGIRNAAARAGNILNTILKFTGSTGIALQPASLATVMERVVEMAGNDEELNNLYQFRRIEIVRDYAPHLSPVLMLEDEIEQVLLNLLKNAAKAMIANPPERPPYLRLATKVDGKYAVIEVEDNGQGMTEDVRRRVFEPFFTTQDVGQGTGMGLSVAYMIVTQNHKGVMEVASQPGNGARFTVRLPLVPGNHSEAPCAPASAVDPDVC